MSRIQRWQSPEFADELRAWVTAQVGTVVLECHKVRPWSTVWRAYDDDHTWWVKQNCRADRFEAALVQLLGECLPDRFVPATAVDLDRGLMLTPDQGETLGFEHSDLATWCVLVQDWAHAQRALVECADDIVAVGVPELSLTHADALLDERISALSELPLEDPRHLDARSRARIAAVRPQIAVDTEVLAALDLPRTLVHNDLHGGNLFRNSRRFFDLGDAVVSDPTIDLLVPLSRLHQHTGCALDAPELWQVAEAWVEVWADVRPARELRAALPHAIRLALIARNEAWYRIVEDVGPEDLDGFGPATTESLVALGDRPLLS